MVEAPAADAAAGARKSQHVRDGIDREVISRVVVTRDPKQCMAKWYGQLRPNMTDTGEWARGDDLKLLTALWRAKPAYVRSSGWHAVCGGVLGAAHANLLLRAWLWPLKTSANLRRSRSGLAQGCAAAASAQAAQPAAQAQRRSGPQHTQRKVTSPRCRAGVRRRVQEFDVKWGELVEGRAEAVARRRWHLMRAYVSDVRNRELPQMVRAARPFSGAWLQGYLQLVAANPGWPN